MPEPTDSPEHVALPRRRRDARAVESHPARSRRELREREGGSADVVARWGESRRERREREEEAAALLQPIVSHTPRIEAEEPVSDDPGPAVPRPLSRRELRALEDKNGTVPAPRVTEHPAAAPAPSIPEEAEARGVDLEAAPVEPEPEQEPSAEPRVPQTVPLEIELVPQHPVVEVETTRHIAEEIVLSAETDFAEPHEHAAAGSSLALSSEFRPRPVPRNANRIRRSVPVTALLSSSSGTFVSHARLQPIKRRILVAFVMAVAALFVASLSIPSFGSALTNDFASVQAPKDVTDSQNLSVAGGPALVASRDDFYAVGAPGSLYSTTNPTVSKESQKLAQELMAAVSAGRLKGSIPDHIPEIQALAEGVAKPDCGIDLRILQVMVIAVRNFDTVAVSDINRKCTGQIEGGGTGSSHYIDGGGHAVDFYLLDGASVPGADSNTLKLVNILDPIMPPGSNLGQSECRSSAGVKLQLQNFKEFSDSCTHIHIDVAGATSGLAINLT